MGNVNPTTNHHEETIVYKAVPIAGVNARGFRNQEYCYNISVTYDREYEIIATSTDLMKNPQTVIIQRKSPITRIEMKGKRKVENLLEWEEPISFKVWYLLDGGTLEMNSKDPLYPRHQLWKLSQMICNMERDVERITGNWARELHLD
jgi:hypothetical protein